MITLDSWVVIIISTRYKDGEWEMRNKACLSPGQLEHVTCMHVTIVFIFLSTFRKSEGASHSSYNYKKNLSALKYFVISFHPAVNRLSEHSPKFIQECQLMTPTSLYFHYYSRSILCYLIIDAFYFIEKTLWPQRLHVILFEVDPLVVEGLQVGLLILLPPYLIETLLSLSPLLLLGFQPEREKHRFNVDTLQNTAMPSSTEVAPSLPFLLLVRVCQEYL